MAGQRRSRQFVVNFEEAARTNFHWTRSESVPVHVSPAFPAGQRHANIESMFELARAPASAAVRCSRTQNADHRCSVVATRFEAHLDRPAMKKRWDIQHS